MLIETLSFRLCQLFRLGIWRLCWSFILHCSFRLWFLWSRFIWHGTRWCHRLNILTSISSSLQLFSLLSLLFLSDKFLSFFNHSFFLFSFSSFSCVSFLFFLILSILNNSSWIWNILHRQSHCKFQMGHIDSFLGGDTILNLINLRFSYVYFKNLGVIWVEYIFNWSFNCYDESPCGFIELYVWWPHYFNILLHVLNGNDSGGIEAHLTAEHHTPDVNATILRLSQLVYHKWFHRQEFNDFNNLFIPRETNTNMSDLWVY